MTRTDPLAEALVVAARLYGEAVSLEALTAGLPLEDGRLTPELVERAAERAGFAARLVSTTVAEISPQHLPAVLLQSDGAACLLVEREGTRARIVYPEMPEDTREVAVSELEAGYSGHAILLGRLQRFSAETATERMTGTHDWFWGTLRREVPTYAEVAVATVLINVFALASPLFFMNVYDRVVPNQAMETLWVLSIGMAIVLAFDLVLKSFEVISSTLWGVAPISRYRPRFSRA
jgi:ATP-binding cassette subfamily C protein LapB